MTPERQHWLLSRSVLLRNRTPFWKGDLPSINLELGEPAMTLAYETADEVPGDRTMLMGSGRPDVTAGEALAAFTRVYPGKQKPTIEQAYVHNWAKDPWAFGSNLAKIPARGTLSKVLAAYHGSPSVGSPLEATPISQHGAWMPPRARPIAWHRRFMRRER